MWSYFEGRQEERGKEQPKRESKTQIHEILQEKSQVQDISCMGTLWETLIHLAH